MRGDSKNGYHLEVYFVPDTVACTFHLNLTTM